jgi:nitrous oxidase accessory protein NosD
VITLNGDGTLRNLKVLGSGSGIGIKLVSGTSCFTVRDVTVQGFKYGVELNNCYTQIWNGCRFEGNDVGVHFAGQWVMNSYFTEGHIAGNRIGVLIETVRRA